MHSDRIALIAGIAALGLVRAGATQTQVQNAGASRTAAASHVAIAPIADKKNASPSAKAANVFC
jgi:hypothetical protein